MRETIFRLDSLRLLVANRGIVDDGVERAERIDLAELIVNARTLMPYTT